jgi:ribosomal protein L22
MEGYAFEGYAKESMAKARGISLGISSKQSMEVCSFIRGKKLAAAKRMLEDVIAMKRAVPFKRFNHNIGHRRGERAVQRSEHRWPCHRPCERGFRIKAVPLRQAEQEEDEEDAHPGGRCRG